jgi:hypothetical protein
MLCNVENPIKPVVVRAPALRTLLILHVEGIRRLPEGRTSRCLPYNIKKDLGTICECEVNHVTVAVHAHAVKSQTS